MIWMDINQSAVTLSTAKRTRDAALRTYGKAKSLDSSLPNRQGLKSVPKDCYTNRKRRSIVIRMTIHLIPCELLLRKEVNIKDIF